MWFACVVVRVHVHHPCNEKKSYKKNAFSLEYNHLDGIHTYLTHQYDPNLE
jgi:hypothetical protein